MNDLGVSQAVYKSPVFESQGEKFSHSINCFDSTKPKYQISHFCHLLDLTLQEMMTISDSPFLTTKRIITCLFIKCDWCGSLSVWTETFKLFQITGLWQFAVLKQWVQKFPCISLESIWGFWKQELLTYDEKRTYISLNVPLGQWEMSSMMQSEKLI